MRTALIDVDGVVIDLMGGMRRYFAECWGRTIDLDRPLEHDNLPDDVIGPLRVFMSLDGCYDMCEPHAGAIDGLASLHALGYDIVFNTSIMESAPETYVSKKGRLAQLIGGRFPWRYAAVPSGLKHRFGADLAVDDRADICLRYARAGTTAFLVARRWSYGGCPETRTPEQAHHLISDPNICGGRSTTVWDRSESPWLGSFATTRDTVDLDLDAWPAIVEATREMHAGEQ